MGQPALDGEQGLQGWRGASSSCVGRIGSTLTGGQSSENASANFGIKGLVVKHPVAIVPVFSEVLDPSANFKQGLSM